MEFVKMSEDDEYLVDREFSGVDFFEVPLGGKSFEDCRFISCGFENTSLANVSFNSCHFSNCRLVLSELKNLTLNQVVFEDCKLVGLNFADCNRFGFFPVFKNCLIDGCVYSANDLKKTNFEVCRFRRSDFINCDLREAVFSESRFEESGFSECRLEEADFRNAAGYRIDPFSNRLKGAFFSLPEAVSFLGFLGIVVD